jgi:aubergine-like protein
MNQEGKKVRTITSVYLVPELMKLTGLTDEQRSDFELMKQLAEFTKLTP